MVFIPRCKASIIFIFLRQQPLFQLAFVSFEFLILYCDKPSNHQKQSLSHELGLQPLDIPDLHYHKQVIFFFSCHLAFFFSFIFYFPFFFFFPKYIMGNNIFQRLWDLCSLAGEEILEQLGQGYQENSEISYAVLIGPFVRLHCIIHINVISVVPVVEYQEGQNYLGMAESKPQ